MSVCLSVRRGAWWKGSVCTNHEYCLSACPYASASACVSVSVCLFVVSQYTCISVSLSEGQVQSLMAGVM